MSLIARLREPTRQQYLAYFAAWSGWVLDAFDFTIFLLVMPHIADEFGVQHVATAGSIALTLLARLAGGWLAGVAGDRWGRKLPLLVSVVWFALCDGAVAFAPSFTVVLVLRTLFGVGMGAEWTSGTTLAMESMPKKLRGLASGVLQGSWAVGYLLAALVSAYVLPRWGWRAMFVIAALPALAALPIRWWVPETAVHLENPRASLSIRAAFRADPALLKALLWGSAVMATGFGAYYGMTGLYPTMLRLELGETDGGVAFHVALFNIGMMAGSIAIGTLAQKRGPTVAIAVPAALSILALPLYAGVFPGTLGLGAVLGGAIGCGFCGATPLVLTSMFPSEIRARMVGLVYHVGAFFAAFVPMTVAMLAKTASLRLSTSLMLVAMGCEALVVALVAGPAILRRLNRPIVARGAAGAAMTAITIVAIAGGSSAGCLKSTEVGGSGGGSADGGGSVTVAGDDPSMNPDNVDAISYLSINSHPGCSTEGLETRNGAGCPKPVGNYTPGVIPGYKCAAKTYPTDKESKNQPILILVHGNSDAPSSWEAFGPDKQPQISERALAAGMKVIAVDFRFDRTPLVDRPEDNPGQNFDHGWAVPILTNLLEAVFKQYPDKQVSIVGFSIGPSIIRDTMRRMHRAKQKPFERIKDLVLASGSNHGVFSYRALCPGGVPKFPAMSANAACELGDRAGYVPTPFLAPLNGPDGAWETPCLDGETAFGQKGVCGGRKVRYTTIVMADKEDGKQQDEFVSEFSSALKGANNLTVPTTSPDTSTYFCRGELFKNHYGAVRSEIGATKIMEALTAP